MSKTNKEKADYNNKIENKIPEIKSFSDLMKVAKSNYLFLILIVVFAFAIYGNSIGGDFVNLDNLKNAIEDNPNVKDISLAIKSASLSNLYLSITYKIFGANPHIFHLFSIIMHVINGMLVFLLTYLIFGKKSAVITTLLFLSHPANTESISWHAGFIYPLRTIAVLLVLIFFTLFRKTNNKKYLFISSGIFLLAMAIMREQGWLFITPFILVLLDQFILEDKIKVKNIKHYIPIGLVSLAFAATLIPGFFKQRLTDLTTLYYVKEGQETPLINRIPYTIYMEYKTLAVPNTLSIYHEGVYISNLEYTFMVIVTLTVIFGIIYLTKKNRKIAGLMIMIIFSILPSFSPRIIAWTAAERYLYIPSIFFSMIISLIILGIGEKIERKNNKNSKKNGERFVLFATALIVLLYSARTVIRNNDFKNSKNLWIATRKTAPYSYRVYNNLGDVYANEGNYELAMENFKRSVALRPDYADAVHNIGHIYLELKDFEKAKKYLGQSLEMNPRLHMAAYKLGFIAYIEGDFDSARTYFNKCLEYQPNDPDCINGINMLNNSQR